MTIKIEISDAARQAFRCAYIPALAKVSWAEKSPAEKAELDCEALGIAFTAALEAMVKEGTACLAYGQITSDNEGDYWTACDEWRTGDFPALIVRLGGKP